MPPSLSPEGSVACCRSATNREQRGAALRAVTLPARPTVGEDDLPRVGDGDLLAADASALRSGIPRRRGGPNPAESISPPRGEDGGPRATPGPHPPGAPPVAGPLGRSVWCL